MWEPFGPPSSDEAAAWKSSPNVRGSLNILPTCVITLLLCTYTSLHLDIAEHKKTGWKFQTRRRVLWVVAVLLAPEFVAFIAFRQMLLARSLRSIVNWRLEHLLPRVAQTPHSADPEIGISTETQIGAATGCAETSHSASSKSFPWTNVHGHFALMGGFAFDLSNMQQTIMESDHTRITLTPAAIQLLAEDQPELLPDISEQAVWDKSKANSFAKCLVCIQACWFIIQTIGRLIMRHVISLLELNTAMHALCCLLIYLAWWQKPLDIEEPYVIDASKDSADSLCAWMLAKDARFETIGVEPDSPNEGTASSESTSKSTHFSYQMLYVEDNCGDVGDQNTHKVIDACRNYNAQAARSLLVDVASQNTRSGQGQYIKICPGQTIHGFMLAIHASHSYLSLENKDLQVHVRSSPAYVERLRLVQKRRSTGFLPRHLIASMSQAERSHDIITFQPRGNAGLLVPANSPFDDLSFSRPDWSGAEWQSSKKVLLVGLLMSDTVYGGIHLLAWNGPFHDAKSRWLWRTSCFIISSPLPLFLATWAFVPLCFDAIHGCFRISTPKQLDRTIRGDVYTHKRGWKPLASIYQAFFALVVWFEDALPKLLVGFLCPYCLLYVAARFYLIAECFINVAHLPDAVFEEPTWSKYLPHFASG